MLGIAVALIFVSIPFVLLVITIIHPRRSLASCWGLSVICAIHLAAIALGRGDEEVLFFTIPTMALCVLSSMLVTVFMWPRSKR